MSSVLNYKQTDHRLLDQPSANPDLWHLDPAFTFLNHGSFGACPKQVLDHQSEIRRRMESQPVTFFVRDLEGLLDQERHGLAEFLNADPEGMALIPNATYGVNAVLRSIEWGRNDECLVTNHEYNACANALSHAVARSGCRIKTIPIPFPISDPGHVLECILSEVTDHSRLLLIDHVTSQTGLILPIKEIIVEMRSRGIRVLVDGAHSAGMVDLNLGDLQPDYYTGNCHKWLCAPKGSAYLWTAPSFRHEVRPLSISHGANSPRKDRSRYLIEFGWTGTWDPSAMLSTSFAIKTMEKLMDGGWHSIRHRNRMLALKAREWICDRLGIRIPSPNEMIGALASVPIPDSDADHPTPSPLYMDSLQTKLFEEFKIEIPVIPWPKHPKRLLRFSCQLYNSLPQYRRLADTLAEILPEVRVKP